LKAEEYLGDISKNDGIARTVWEEIHQFEREQVPKASEEEIAKVCDCRFGIAPGVRRANQKDGSVLIMHPKTSMLKRVNAAGWAVMQQMDGTRSVDDVIDQTVNAFKHILEWKKLPVSPRQTERLRADYKSFVVSLASQGFLRETVTNSETGRVPLLESNACDARGEQIRN
jgi:hypothetical protein